MMNDFTNEVGLEDNKASAGQSAALVPINVEMLMKEVEQCKILVSGTIKRLRLILPDRQMKELEHTAPPVQQELCEIAKQLSNMRMSVEKINADLRYIRDNVQV